MQGDIAFVDAARAMGASIDASPGRLVVRRGRLPLLPIRLDCNHMPDAAMTLAALALFADGPSRLENIASWRVKETDRLAAMATELRKLGAAVTEGSDFLEITPPARWQAASIATYDDHRMAMAISLAAFNAAAGASPAVPVRILDPRCVGKTWPDYFETLLGAATAPRSAIPVLTIDGPTASGKGRWPAPSPRRSATTCSIPAPCTGRRRSRPSMPGWLPTTKTAWRRWPPASTCASPAGEPPSARAR